jgi:aryl-alcohol dehydrogenase-like predicted oxidoreductase
MLAGAELGRLGLGTMSLTGRGTSGNPADPTGARALLRRAAELGVQLFNTADSYGPDTAENLLREALHPYVGLLVATKGGFRRQLRSPRLAVIPGTASVAHLEENVGAAALRLEPAELAALDRERLWSYRAERVARRARTHAGRARRALRGRVR